MAVKSNGALSFDTDIKGEFRGSRPLKLSNYYLGGSLVSDSVSSSGGASNIPTSGAISFSDFYGESWYASVSVNIPAYQTQRYPVSGNSWSQRTVDIQEFTSSYTNTTITIPTSEILIRGDEDEGFWDDDHSGIRNPGYIIYRYDGEQEAIFGFSTPIWTEILRVRGSATDSDDDSPQIVDIPSGSVTTTGDRFKIAAVADTYDGGGGTLIKYEMQSNLSLTLEVSR